MFKSGHEFWTSNIYSFDPQRQFVEVKLKSVMTDELTASLTAAEANERRSCLKHPRFTQTAPRTPLQVLTVNSVHVSKHKQQQQLAVARVVPPGKRPVGILYF